MARPRRTLDGGGCIRAAIADSSGEFLVSPALFALGRWCYRRRGTVAITWVVVLLLLGALAGLFAKGTSDEFTVPGSESQATLEDLRARFPELAGSAAQIVIVSPEGRRIDTPATTSAVSSVVPALERIEGVASVNDPFDKDSPTSGTISTDGRAAIVSVQLDGDSQQVSTATKDAISAQADRLRAQLPGSAVEIGGSAYGNVPPRMSWVEGLGLIVALVVLLGFFRSLRGAMAPLVVAISAAGVSIALLLLSTAFVALTSTAPMLALMLGIAVGIDYSLFLLSRFRENVRDGIDGEEAAARATATAGSAVVFAGITVITALVGLVIVGLPFLSAMGVSAAVAVAVAVVGALTIGPALMGTLTRHVQRPAKPSLLSRLGDRLPGRRRRGTRWRHAGPQWPRRWIAIVTRLPALTAVVVLAVLAVAAIPAKDLRLALPDNGTAPTTHSQRLAYDLTAEHFGPGENGPLLIVADLLSSNDPLGYMDQLRAQVEAVPGVDRVVLSTPNRGADTGVVIAIPTTAPSDPATADLVERLREEAPSMGGTDAVRVRVAGLTAAQIDVSTRLADALVPFGVVVIGLSLVLLLIVFRSFVVPLTAALGFLLSVGASFGAVTAVFEWGWLADALHVARVGPVISFMPIILMGVLFGLAMDYQMFIVSRMHELYAMTRDPQASVREGFIASAPVVAAAAIIMVAVFAAFIPEGDASMKPIALGLTVGVFVDAFIVRMILVPAVLQLLGHAAWSMPGWLADRLPHLDVEGHGVAHQIAAEATIAQHPDRVVHARELAVSGHRGEVFSGLDLDVCAGTLALLVAAEGGGKTAALLAISGRLEISAGELDVAGAVVPEQAALVQRRAALAEFPSVNALADDLDVAAHIAERLAPRTMLPWARRSDIRGVLTRYDELCDVAGVDPVAPDTLVGDIGRLQRTILGIVLAGIGEPALVLVDEADALPTRGERIGLWAVLGRVVDTQTYGVTPAVLVACHESPDLGDLATWTGLDPARLQIVPLHDVPAAVSTAAAEGAASDTAPLPAAPGR